MVDRSSGKSGAEPLLSVEHPDFSTPLSSGIEQAGIRSGSRHGLGHRERGTYFARCEGQEVAFALGRVAQMRKQVDVSFIGRRSVQGQRTQQAAAGFLENDRDLAPAEAQPAKIPGPGRKK